MTDEERSHAGHPDPRPAPPSREGAESKGNAGAAREDASPPPGLAPSTPGGAADLFADWDDLEESLEVPRSTAPSPPSEGMPPWAAPPYPPGVFPGAPPGRPGANAHEAGPQGFVEPDLTGGPQEVLEAVVEALKTIYDPEIPVNIFDLGLIYGVHVDDEGMCTVKMTLTAPGCPAAVILPEEVRYRAGMVEGVRDAKVDIVWDPPWTPARMSESARLELGFF